MYKILLPFLILIITSCNNQTQTSVEKDSVVADTPKEEMKIMVPQSACYISISNKDTIKLKVERFPNVVTGTLEYNLFEKDKNKGEYDGKLYGDTLIADYTFLSEGTKSVRQVAFLLTDSGATEGYADMEEKDGKMIFKNTGKLDFSKGIKLHMINCATE